MPGKIYYHGEDEVKDVVSAGTRILNDYSILLRKYEALLEDYSYTVHKGWLRETKSAKAGYKVASKSYRQTVDGYLALSKTIQTLEDFLEDH